MLRMRSLTVLLMASLPALMSGLQCYYCEAAKNVSCPGWERPPIDSVNTKQDVVGLFNHCVTVKLADGRIIEQNIYPGSTHCQEIFIQSWTMLLNSQWNQDVTIDCCTSELCNGPRDKTLAWSSATRLLHLPPVLMLASLLLISSI